jgi:hypothetical protein
MVAPTIASDRSGADDDAELEELAANALGAPERVLAGHGGDQLTDLWAQAGPAQMRAATPAPVEAPASAVPAEDGLRSDEDEMPPPGREEPAKDQPEESTYGLEVRPRARRERDLELVA